MGKLYKAKSDKIVIRKAPKKKTFAKKVKAILNKNVEQQYVDVTKEWTAFTAGTAQFSLLNGTTQGDTVNDRAGDEIRQRSLMYRFNFRAQNDGAVWGQQACSFRLLIVVDKQPNKAIFAITDLLKTASVNSYINYANRKRFRILHDRVYSYDPNTSPTLATNGDIVDYSTKKIHINLKDLKTEYSGDAGTVADIVKNSIYAVFLTNSDEVTGTADLPKIESEARLFFKD